MATREERFRQAAWAYFIYGILYMIGAVYLAGQGVAPPKKASRAKSRWSRRGASLSRTP